MAISREKYFRERGKDLRKAATHGRTKTWNVQHIWDVHHEIKRRIFLGQKNVVIAAAVGRSPEQVSSVRNSPVIKRELEIMHGAKDAETLDLRKRIDKISLKAHENLEELMNTGKVMGKEASVGQIIKSSESALDRAGWAAPKKLQMESTNFHFTPDDID